MPTIYKLTKKTTYVYFLCIGLMLTNPVFAQNQSPAVEWTSMFKIDMYPTGFFNIRHLDLVFVPEGAAVQSEIKTASGESVLTFNALSTKPQFTNNAFSRYQMRGTSSDKLTAGDYVIETKINDSLASRMAFSVYQESSDDPFATNDKVHFSGDWQKLAYLHFVKARNFSDNVDYQSVNLRIWSSLSDLPVGERSDQVIATLKQDGKVFGYSKTTSGALTANSEINRLDLVLFKPHDRDSEANVLVISEAELVDGDHNYQLSVVRQSDGQVLRNFSFQSKGGVLVPMARSEMGHTPQHEYLAPRALVQGTQNYEFETVYWMQTE